MFHSNNFKNFNKIRHCFFSKKNGFSKGIYKSLNCGKGSNDNQKLIEKNLRLISKYMNTDNNNLVLMNQSHSNKVILLNKKNKNLKKFDCDSIVTDLKGYAISVLTADCVPILLYDKKNDVIGCIHAGWKGALLGIIENTILEFKKLNSKLEIHASVGPCIGKSSYEVDLDFVKKFEKESKKNLLFFKKKDKFKLFFDIRGYINNKLEKLGISYIDNIELDTFQDSSNFFSFRRSQKLKESDYGRCISTICLKT